MKKDLLVFVSGYNNSTSEDFTPDIKRMIERIEGISIIDVMGCYNGVQEQTLIVTCQQQNQVREILLIACTLFNQDCIMVRHGDGSCTLECLQGSTPLKGTLQEVNEQIAIDNGDYTIVGGKFWIVGV